MTDNPQQAALKPCPFCGGEPDMSFVHADSRGAHEEYWWIRCRCGLTGRTFSCEHFSREETRTKAIAIWNTRTPAPVDHAALAQKLAGYWTDTIAHIAAGKKPPAMMSKTVEEVCTALRAHPAGGVSDELERMLLDLLARIHGDGGQYSVSHGLDKSYHDANLIVANLRAAGMTQPPSGMPTISRERLLQIGKQAGFLNGGVMSPIGETHDGTLYAKSSMSRFIELLEKECGGQAGIGSGVPEGWKLVRLMPDDETIAVAWQAVDSDRVSEVDVEKILRAGIAAAPSHDKAK